MLVDFDSDAALAIPVVVHAAGPALALFDLIHLPLAVVIVLCTLGLP